MNAALVVLLAVQQPQVSVSVDRVEALVGDLVTLSIRVEAEGGEPVRVIDPILGGFEVRGTSEATQVRIVGGIPHRTFTRELRLLAMRPGTATIGAVRVRQGEEVVETAVITVSVGAPAGGSAPALTPAVRTMVDTVQPPPGGEEVVLRVIALPTALVLGGQLDLVTLAWFRRDVRRQLRTPPTLTPPEVEGVWSYRQNTPAGIVVSRRSGQWWYDLFVSHQVLFPLTDGRLEVGAATVSYVVPLTYSFLSRELQHQVRSDTLSIAVSSQPVAGRPPAFSGAAGSAITLDFSVSPTQLQAGGAATATVTLDGIGNVALWPEPQIRWPLGIRVYPTEVNVDLAPRGGRIAGQKRFTYLLVADSTGTHPIPAVSYAYFDPARRRYEQTGATGAQLVAPLASLPAATRPTPPPLLPAEQRIGLGARLDRLPTVAWLLVALLPPMFVFVPRLRLPARRRAAARAAAARRAGGPLEQLDHEFRAALGAMVPDAEHREGPALVAALRAAGIDPSLAAHAVRVRDRLHHAVFGPAGNTDPDELGAEVHEVLRALAGEGAPRTRRDLLPVAVLLLAAVGSATAQDASPEQLYEAGAVRAAADAFLERARLEPRQAAHWYGLGNALYLLGEDGRARVAWVRAARLAPRRREIRRALDLLPDDSVTERLARVRPFTPGEAWALGGALWILGWTLIGLRRARPAAWVTVTLGVLVGAAGGQVAVERGREVAVIVVADAPMRTAPFGSATAPRTLPEGSAVRVQRRDGAWLLVRRGDALGWLHADEVTHL